MGIRATAPFVFYGCVELREILGLRARDEQELMEQVERAPLASVYYHTHNVFLRREHTAGAYPNDFANWVAFQVRDQVLGERLAVVDPLAFASLEELREELVSIIDHHIGSLQSVPRVVFGEPFFFIQSHTIEVPTEFQARTHSEFRASIAEVDASAIYLHAVASRVWRGRRRGDFAEWVERSLGLPSLADEIAEVNPYMGGLEEVRARLLRLLDAVRGDTSATHGD